ncbi:MAG: glycosyltransferase [Pseudomarimonas sp.]
MTRLYVAGVGLRGSGYPNAEQTMRVLATSGDWEVEDHANWLPEHVHLWRMTRGPLVNRLALGLRLLFGNAAALLRVLLRPRALVYAPYPSVFLLWWASWLPRRWRPRIVADAYISLWDSAFRDRRRTTGPNVLATLCKAFEARALRAAQFVLVDSVANRDWMIAEFRLDSRRVRAFPLAIEDAPFLALPCKPRLVAQPLHVLFIGTLIPLHGISVLAEAIRSAAGDSGLSFHLVGDGQEAALLDQLLKDPNRAPVLWERSWMSIDALAARIAACDVCLGVFGGEGKAARVLPFKVYLALAAGKAVVTQRNYSLPAGVPSLPALTVNADPGALLGALRELRDDPARLAQLADASARFHHDWLGALALQKCWQTLIADDRDMGGSAPAS